MIGKASVITHGANAVRYSADKDMAEIVKVNNMPEDITPSAMWARMMHLQKFYEAKLSRYHPLKNTSIRIELSPTPEESKGWTVDDWRKLAEDYIKEFDLVDLSKRAKRKSAASTNLKGSQYVVSLHRDSMSGILHLHINANRIDMMGNVNDAHFIYERAMAAAAKINQQHGWVDASVISQDNKDKITLACHEVLRKMNCFDWNVYAAGLTEHGYHVELKRASDGEVKGYTVAKVNSIYKSSELGKGRKLMPSKILATWRLYHPEATKRTVTPVTPAKPRIQPMPQPKPVVRQPKPVTVVDTPKMHHFDFSTDEFHKYPVDISDKALNVINENIVLDKDNVFATIEGIQKTALLLFANYLDAATTIAAQNGGGGGSSQTSGWGRDKDEDELSWAHRCAMMANRLCRPRKKIGIGR